MLIAIINDPNRVDNVLENSVLGNSTAVLKAEHAVLDCNKSRVYEKLATPKSDTGVFIIIITINYKSGL